MTGNPEPIANREERSAVQRRGRWVLALSALSAIASAVLFAALTQR